MSCKWSRTWECGSVWVAGRGASVGAAAANDGYPVEGQSRSHDEPGGVRL